MSKEQGIYPKSERVIVAQCKVSNFGLYHDEKKYISIMSDLLDLYSVRSLKQRSVCMHVAPLGDIILIPRLVFAFFLLLRASGESSNTNCIVSGFILPGLEPWSPANKANMPTITTPMRYEHAVIVWIYYTMGFEILPRTPKIVSRCRVSLPILCFNTCCVFVFVLCLVYPMMPVFMDCTFLISPSVLSNI
jgi:hypothetical protein